MPTTCVYSTMPGHGANESRRTFLKHGVLLVASTLLAISPDVRAASVVELVQAATTMLAVPCELLTRSLFASYKGQLFAIGQDARVTLELAKVRDLRSAPTLIAQNRVVDAEQNFSIVFRGSLDQLLVQDVYDLEHSQIGRFSVLLVPMRPEQDGRYYEAIFNRLREHEMVGR